METRTRNGIVFAALAALTAVGLGAVARHRKALDLGAHAIDAIPAGALLVATADITALRASPVGAPFLREGRVIKGLGKVKDVCGFDPMESIHEVALGIPAAGDSGEFGLVAAGPLDDEALVTCASKVIEARGGHAVTTTIGTFRTVRDQSLPTGGGEIAVRKGGPLLLGAGTYLRSMIDAAEGHAPTIRSSVAHGFLAREVGDAALRVTVVLTPDQRKALAEELQAGGAAGSPAGSILAGGLGVSLGQTVGLHAVLSCDTADACSALAKQLAAARDARAKDIAIRIVGFGAVLERITLEPRGDVVHARVDMPPEEAATLADRLLTLRGMRHPMPGDEASEPPPAAPKPDEVVKPDAGATRGAGSAADAGARAAEPARPAHSAATKPASAPR